MKRRQIIAGLFALGFCLPGCESLRHQVRPKADDTAEEGDEARAVGVHSKPPKGFFKGSRLPGGLSPESREIENDLGIQ